MVVNISMIYQVFEKLQKMAFKRNPDSLKLIWGSTFNYCYVFMCFGLPVYVLVYVEQPNPKEMYRYESDSSSEEEVEKKESMY